jgi:lysophospholipase L1-like esterase
MKIAELIKTKTLDRFGTKPVTVAFLGDSVTHGCFELYRVGKEGLETVFEIDKSYSTRFKEILNKIYPATQITVINSGISGDTTEGALKRVDRDVLSFNPDLVVVSLGLNDCCTMGAEGVEKYKENLSNIFKKINEKGIEIIFITQNDMCDYVRPSISDEIMKIVAERTVKARENLKSYFDGAKEVAKKYGVEVIDLFSVWGKLKDLGVDTTMLLSNDINHPIREYHYYMAIKLVEKVLGL